MELNGFQIEQWNVHGFDIKGKTTGKVYCTCPFCSHERKKKNDKCATAYLDTGYFKCNHCGEEGQLHSYKKNEQVKKYNKPEVKPILSPLSDNLTNYIQDTRKISVDALKALKIREAKEWMPQTKKEENCICFDYYLEGEVINVKYRDGKKHFKLFKGAEKIFYNLDNIATEKDCIIVEGEFDVLAFHTAGYSNCVSVPNGFNLQGNISLDYLDNYLNYFENKETIYLAVDNDEAGRKGEKELIRRLGADKVKLVNFEDCKDANDYLVKHGKEKLANLISLAKDVRMEGIFTANDVRESMLDSYNNGQKRGTTTYIEEIDPAWTWREGEVNLWTGYQNEGKSAMISQLCTIRAYWENAKVAVFSPENMPLDDFYTDIIEMFIGKSADPYYKNHYMSKEEFLEGMEFVTNNFFLIYPEKDFTIESIFERAKFLVKKSGIRTLVIDPYNTIEHRMKSGEREDLYISRFMAQLKRFAVEYDVSVHLVAHQLTARKNANDGNRYFKPDANNIKGGGTFADKADNVISIWRPNRAVDFKDTSVAFLSQKIKKQKLVGRPQEVTDIDFEIKSNRYLFNGTSPFSKIDADRLGIAYATPQEQIENYIPPRPENASLDQAFGSTVNDEDSDVPF
ncbi:toprim domain-containing protein [Zunongwangia sp. F260]|uniref:Toprim domain-containing protein n=1 Tax=Autumnicola lenta TaxID=3075593 RepID=A0ABU3CJ00_9FLAO|nr:toprim domain-containing protein [Zunongwangia sp. F260]MDT0646320.1 toprim domain-containing protein [Zunongwangia sp. F260]